MQSKKATTFEGVAKEEKLEGNIKNRFIRYMRTRWANEEHTQCVTGYANEWAQRFLNGSEYACSDTSGQRLLNEMSLEG